MFERLATGTAILRRFARKHLLPTHARLSMFGSQGSWILVVQQQHQVLKSACMFVGETARVLDSTALKVQSSHGHRLLQQWAWSIQESLGKHGQSLA